MTHHETTGTPENDDATGIEGPESHDSTGIEGPESHDSTGVETPKSYDAPGTAQHQADGPDRTAYDGHAAEHQVTLRTPAELADALPYLLGYRPEDSIVLVALHDRDGRGRFGGRARLGIPASADDWDSAAGQLADGLVRGSERRGARPEQMVAFLCQEPATGETGRQVMERLRPLAQRMRVACGSLDVPVIEALCISEGRFWSYCCDREECCPSEGRAMGLPGTSVLAAAATYAGVQVRGTLRELRARLLPWETAAALKQEIALDTAGMALVPRILDDATRAGVAEETLRLAERLMSRFAEVPPASGTLTADLRDDELLGHDEAARLVLGLQDRATRDRAAEWMEGDEAGPALRLWRALARRCVGPYGEHAAAPLTLAGWVAWSTGDELEAREALAMALGADSDYLFARLLHQACNEGLDPESIRRCLRAERVGRDQRDAGRLDGPGGVDQSRGIGEAVGVDQSRGVGVAVGVDQLEGVGEAVGVVQSGGVGEVVDLEVPVGDEAVRGEAASTGRTSAAGARRRARHPAGPAGGLPRSATASGRERVTRVPRSRTSAGMPLGAQRPGSAAARTPKGTGARTAKGTAPRIAKKGGEGRSGSRRDGVRSKNPGAEGDA